MRGLWRHLGLVALAVTAQPAHAVVSTAWNYIKQYQVGIDYTSSYDTVSASYETARAGSHDSCAALENDATRQRCHLDLHGGGGSGFGLFLQQAFKRQGLFYFKPDIGFGLRYLEGRLPAKKAREYEQAGLPLRSMDFALAAVVIKPYITLGITPAKTWPDLLVSIGPAAQLAMGKVTVNDKDEAVAMLTSSGLLSGFFEVEVVFWRFGDGALSLFQSRDFTGDGRGTKFYPKAVDGMDDIRANFRRSVHGDGNAGFYGLGVKLVLDWP